LSFGGIQTLLRRSGRGLPGGGGDLARRAQLERQSLLRDRLVETVRKTEIPSS